MGYNHNNVIETILQHIEIPGLFRRIKAFSDIFRDIQQIQSFSGKLRDMHMQALLRCMEPNSDILRTLRNPCMYNSAILRILAYLEPESSSKSCWTCKMIMHIQSHGIVRTVCSSIFKDIQRYSGNSYSVTLTCTTRRREEASSTLFENGKKCPDFGKKGLDCVHLWVEFSIQNVVLRLSKGKFSRKFLLFLMKCLLKRSTSISPPPPSSFPVLKDFN